MRRTTTRTTITIKNSRGNRDSMFLESHCFTIFAPHAAQSIADLTYSRKRFDAFENSRDSIFGAARGLFEIYQRELGGGRVATFAQRLKTFDLIGFDRWIDPQRFHLRAFVALKLVHADDDCVVRFDRALIFISRILNLALNVP